MGAHLGWEPSEPQPLGGSLSTAMKHALAEQFTWGDVTEVSAGLELDELHLQWLEGVKVGRCAGDDLYDDAESLIAGIKRHKCIRMVRT